MGACTLATWLKSAPLKTAHSFHYLPVLLHLSVVTFLRAFSFLSLQAFHLFQTLSSVYEYCLLAWITEWLKLEGTSGGWKVWRSPWFYPSLLFNQDHAEPKTTSRQHLNISHNLVQCYKVQVVTPTIFPWSFYQFCVIVTVFALLKGLEIQWEAIPVTIFWRQQMFSTWLSSKFIAKYLFEMNFT